jgi:hypothetical protein
MVPKMKTLTSSYFPLGEYPSPGYEAYLKRPDLKKDSEKCPGAGGCNFNHPSNQTIIRQKQTQNFFS